ncbi:hypothetical protein ESCO_005869 [Escovopsis weberi]|uniref:Extracellular membrane protein CFEM domain-containing protein n=1 Tax=Escovopsis weberi TaxID=150374 RepID=A0A0M8MQ69_ESCWE|nr:hypothetical protein ESCO_005869 [Escovopsis weberi]
MKLSTLVLAAAAAAPLVDACKCIMPSGLANIDWTLKCCKIVPGAKANGNDCNAHSMSQKLSRFHDCCQGMGRSLDIRTDCPCPAGCKENPFKNVYEKRRRFFHPLA